MKQETENGWYMLFFKLKNAKKNYEFYYKRLINWNENLIQ